MSELSFSRPGEIIRPEMDLASAEAILRDLLQVDEMSIGNLTDAVTNAQLQKAMAIYAKDILSRSSYIDPPETEEEIPALRRIGREKPIESDKSLVLSAANVEQPPILFLSLKDNSPEQSHQPVIMGMNIPLENGLHPITVGFYDGRHDKLFFPHHELGNRDAGLTLEGFRMLIRGTRFMAANMLEWEQRPDSMVYPEDLGLPYPLPGTVLLPGS